MFRLIYKAIFRLQFKRRFDIQLAMSTRKDGALPALFLISELCCSMYCLCRLCCSVYCLCVNVYCTAATGCQTDCMFNRTRMSHLNKLYNLGSWSASLIDAGLCVSLLCTMHHAVNPNQLRTTLSTHSHVSTCCLLFHLLQTYSPVDCHPLNSRARECGVLSQLRTTLKLHLCIYLLRIGIPNEFLAVQ